MSQPQSVTRRKHHVHKHSGCEPRSTHQTGRPQFNFQWRRRNLPNLPRWLTPTLIGVRSHAVEGSCSTRALNCHSNETGEGNKGSATLPNQDPPSSSSGNAQTRQDSEAHLQCTEDSSTQEVSATQEPSVAPGACADAPGATIPLCRSQTSCRSDRGCGASMPDSNAPRGCLVEALPVLDNMGEAKMVDLAQEARKEAAQTRQVKNLCFMVAFGCVTIIACLALSLGFGLGKGRCTDSDTKLKPHNSLASDEKFGALSR